MAENCPVCGTPEEQVAVRVLCATCEELMVSIDPETWGRSIDGLAAGQPKYAGLVAWQVGFGLIATAQQAEGRLSIATIGSLVWAALKTFERALEIVAENE